MPLVSMVDKNCDEKNLGKYNKDALPGSVGAEELGSLLGQFPNTKRPAG